MMSLGWLGYYLVYKPTVHTQHAHQQSQQPPPAVSPTENTSGHASRRDTPQTALGLPPRLIPLEAPEAIQPEPLPPPPPPPAHVAKMMRSVEHQISVTHSYDPSYVKIAYPNGDVDESTGVCTDVVVRAFRANNVDLQKLVHKDMRRNFRKYPKKWGHKRPDTNIDHRRVPNLMTFLERQGKSLPVTDDPDNYKAGDLVVWDLGTGQYHIGMVLHWKNYQGTRPLIGHNIAYGTQIEDFLFKLPIVGHYRYFDAPLIALNSPEDGNADPHGHTTTALQPAPQ